MRGALGMHPHTHTHVLRLECRQASPDLTALLRRCRFIDLLGSSTGGLKPGQPELFVSHAWAAPFADMVGRRAGTLD